MVDYQTFVFIGKILTYSTIFPFVFSWLKLKIPSYLLPLRILFILSFISTYALGFFKNVYDNNLFVGVIYVTIEYVLFSRMYYLEIPTSTVKKFIKYSAYTLFVLAIINLIFIQGFFNENSYTRSVLSLITILLAFMYFWSMLNRLNVENLYQHPMFWVNCGVILFAAASFVLFLFSGHLQATKNYGPLITFWTVKNVFGIVRNIFFSYAFWLNFKHSNKTKTLLTS